MSLITLTLANTPFDHITLTNSLTTLMNNLTDQSGVFQSNGTLIFSGSGTALYVNNAATFGIVNSNSVIAVTVTANTVNIRGVDVLNHANNAYAASNLVYTFANSAYAQANSANSANGYGYIWANTAFNTANAAYTQANTANSTSGFGYIWANTAYDAANTKVTKSGDTMTGQLILPASNTTASSLRMPHGAAPSSPINGDVWSTTAGLFVRTNGSTVGPLSGVPGQTLSRLLFMVG